MKDTDTRGDTFWQYSWECKGEESSVLMNSDGVHAPTPPPPPPPTPGTMNELPASNLSLPDDMTSWLHLDDPSYCSQMFGPGADRAASPFSSSLQVYRDYRLFNMPKDPKPAATGTTTTSATSTHADAALALAAGRAAGFFPQAGAEAFHRSRTVFHPSSKMVNFANDSMALVSDGSPSVHAHSAGHAATAGVSVTAAGGLNFPQFYVSVSPRCATSSDVGEPMSFNWKSQGGTSSLQSERSTLECRSPGYLNGRSETGGGSSRVTSSYDTKVSQEASKNTLTSSTGGTRGEKELKRKEKDIDDTAGNEDSVDKKKPPKSSKRSRAAEVHNLSERKRRDRINERMRALQELIPNSNKTDKASMLDEAIEYLKMLQHQLQVMSMRTGIMPGVPHMQMSPVTAAYGGMPIRLVDMSGHHPLLQPHAHGMSVNVAVPVSMAQAGYMNQGMNSDIYHASQVPPPPPQQQQQQRQQQQRLQQQQQLQDHSYNQSTQTQKQENE